MLVWPSHPLVQGVREKKSQYAPDVSAITITVAEGGMAGTRAEREPMAGRSGRRGRIEPVDEFGERFDHASVQTRQGTKARGTGHPVRAGRYGVLKWRRGLALHPQ
jgi:hypothetical protein